MVVNPYFTLSKADSVISGQVLSHPGGNLTGINLFLAEVAAKRLSFDFSLPDQPGYETAKKIAHLYGDGGDGPSSVLVVTYMMRPIT